MKIQITYTGGKSLKWWDRAFVKFLGLFRKTMWELAEEAMLKTQTDLKNAIINKDRSSFIKRLRRINEAWVVRKKKHGWKPHQLAATTEYANAIEMHVVPNESITLRMKKGTYPGRSFTYDDLARFLEYGTKRMKPLPHWRKATKFFKEELKRLSKEEYGRGIRISR